MLLINNEVVAQILNIKGCMEALETGYRDLIDERAAYRGRYDFFVPNDEPKLMYRWGTMEGASRSFETFAIRMKSDMLEWPEGKTVEKYCIQPGTFCGVVMVFSTRNGEPLAIINDGIIQHMRVGGQQHGDAQDQLRGLQRRRGHRDRWRHRGLLRLPGGQLLRDLRLGGLQR